jgi:transcriptional regulator with GAF, ATPase, and Fis domain
MNSSPRDLEATFRELSAHWLGLITAAWPSSLPGATPAAHHPWTAKLLTEVADLLQADSVELVCQSGTRWVNPLAEPGSSGTIADRDTIALVAEALASGSIQSGRGRVAAIAAASGAGRADSASQAEEAHAPLVLVAVGSRLDSHQVDQAARVIAASWRVERAIAGSLQASARLRYLLDASIRWSLIDDTDSLLNSIAGAATELLQAERASIFLWEKRRGKLIGRPALGVPGGKLEVDDDAGVVGAVLRERRPQLWAVGEDAESEVNRSVDRRLHYVTRSLAAVPLESPTGELLGVFEVLNKRGADGNSPFGPADIAALADLARHAAAAIQEIRSRERLTQTRDRLLHDAASTYQLLGDSPAIRSLRDAVARVAPTDLAVLVLGENGTGKEVLARSLHFQSPRRDQPFIAVNCAALVESLLESELFGHQRGAFTDAHQDRAGKFELANGGTLLLDEIGDMSPGGQAKLLRVLEEKVVTRVGGATPIPVDVRIIAATNQPLGELVAAKRFREDLFFRLNVVSFRLPSLRERGGDILLLANHFLQHFAQRAGRPNLAFSEPARQALLDYRWPGNVREMRNVMERVSYLANADEITAADLGLSPATTPFPSAAGPLTGQLTGHPASGADRTLTDLTRDFQIEVIRSTIGRHQGNISAAAVALGLHRTNLYRKMRQLGLASEGESE